jgi:hypothetical protein
LRQRPQQRKTRATATVFAVAISVLTVNSALLLRAKEGKAQEMTSSDSLSFFADEQDAPILLDRLNADPEIAFIVPDGPRISPRPASPPRGDRPPTTGFVAQVATCGGGGYWQKGLATSHRGSERVARETARG